MGNGSGSALGVAHQTAQDNYTYDETGNLIADAQDRIKIEWTVYGKVKSVAKTDGSQAISYLYDASGNRTVKTVTARNATTGAVTVTSTYYVRDAQGNVLAVYDDNNGTGTLRQSEVYLYGSSRLGVFRPQGNRSLATNGVYTRRLQQKEYELTDHLGNVRALIGDYRQSEGGGIRAALKAYFNHYAFGLEMPGMVWKGGNGYRYGYNGKEIDADFANNYDYGFRIYDEASCRFLSVDPIAASYPFYSPYHFAGNQPIVAVDVDGLEPKWVHTLYDGRKVVKQTVVRSGELAHETNAHFSDVLGVRLLMSGTVYTSSQVTDMNTGWSDRVDRYEPDNMLGYLGLGLAKGQKWLDDHKPDVIGSGVSLKVGYGVGSATLRLESYSTTPDNAGFAGSLEFSGSLAQKVKQGKGGSPPDVEFSWDDLGLEAGGNIFGKYGSGALPKPGLSYGFKTSYDNSLTIGLGSRGIKLENSLDNSGNVTNRVGVSFGFDGAAFKNLGNLFNLGKDAKTNAKTGGAGKLNFSYSTATKKISN